MFFIEGLGLFTSERAALRSAYRLALHGVAPRVVVLTGARAVGRVALTDRAAHFATFTRMRVKGGGYFVRRCAR